MSCYVNEGGYSEEAAGTVAVPAKQGKALIKIIGWGKVSSVIEVADRGSRQVGRFSALCHVICSVALSADGRLTVYVRSIKRLWKLFALYLAAVFAALAAGGAAYAVEIPADDGYISINSVRTGITFTNTDQTGVGFGYVIYADGKLLERSQEISRGGDEYTVTLYDRLEPGKHELRVESHCYSGDDDEAFDVISRTIWVEVE